MRLKSLRITRETLGGYTVTPQYYGRRGGTVTLHKDAERSEQLAEALALVIAKVKPQKGLSE